MDKAIQLGPIERIICSELLNVCRQRTAFVKRGKVVDIIGTLTLTIKPGKIVVLCGDVRHAAQVIHDRQFHLFYSSLK